jgi:hypothetical protein
MEKIQPSRQDIIEDVRLWSKNFLDLQEKHGQTIKSGFL